MRFSDFLLVSDPADLDFIVGYSGEQNIRIDVSDFFADNISGSGNPGYIPVFTSNQVIGNSQIFQDGSNIVIGGVNAMGYRLAVGGSLYALGGTTIESVTPGSDTFRTIGEEGDSFIIPNDEDESIWTSRRIIHAPAVLTTESATLGQLNTAISSLEGDIELLLDLKVDKTSVGAPNGVASLDATGKIPLSEIPDSIIGQVEYMGTWNALTNTPTLNPLVPEEKGHYYVVSVAGTFGGVDYQVGDWIISNGVYWDKIDNTDAVTSVFGRIGAILALEADYQSFYPRLSQAYDNPTWINTLAFSKITDVPPFLLENQTITLSGDVTGSGKTSILSTISNNAVTDSKLRDSVGTSVIGRASTTTGDPADIQAIADGQVLQRSGGTLLFGLISSDSIASIDWSKIINTPTTLSGYGITDAYTKVESDNKFVPYTGASANVNLGSNNITANAFVKVGGTSAQFLKADGSVDVSQYVPTTRSVNAGTGLTGGGNLSSDITIAFDTNWGDIRYAYRTREIIAGTGLLGGGDLSANRTLSFDTVWGDARYLAPLAGYVPYTGATANVDLGEKGIRAGYIQLDTTPTSTPTAQGTIYWDQDDNTIDAVLNGYIMKIGEDQFYPVKNQTGASIPKGTAVRFAGTVGASGRLLIQPFIADGSVPSTYFMGVTAETIADGADGKVLWFGRVRGINTTAYNEGDILYASTTVPGGFQTAVPVAPNNIVQVAAVITVHANNGTIFIRPTLGSNINKDEGVKITSPVVGQLLQLQSGNIWENKSLGQVINGLSSQFLKGDGSLDSTSYVPFGRQITINGTTYDLSSDRVWNVGTVTSVGLSVPVGFAVSNSPITSTGNIALAFDTGYSLPTDAKQLEWDTAYANRIASLTTNGTSGAATFISNVLNIPQYQAQGNYITNLTGEVTADGPGSVVATISNSAVTGKVLTGLSVTGSSILASDTILEAFGKLQGQVNGLVGGLMYEGTWDASTNTPTITSGVGVDGTFYIVSVAGNTTIDGLTDWQVGDWIVFHTPSWQKVDNTESVTSVNGQVGAVSLSTGQIPEGTNLYFTDERSRQSISLTTTGSSGAATYSDVTGVFNIPQYSLSGLGGVPTSRVLTINGVNYDLSADRSWTVGDVRTDSSYANPSWITSLAWGKITGTPTTLAGYGITDAYTQAQVDSLLSGYVTLATDQTITGLKTIVRSGDVLNFKIGTDTLYGLKVAYNQNELVPSGEATWSFVNTFNRNGVGYEVTPLSFFRGVLVTGERLLTASINSNLLDYYGNNPSGRYPVYAYNTGVQQFSTGILVGYTTGLVNAVTGAISQLPSGVVANFNGRVIGQSAANSNEFVTLSQLSDYVPTSRTLTINGVTYDLSANRSWTITSGVSSVTATSPLFSSGGATPNITIQQATATQDGFLSSTDWSTFNSKIGVTGGGGTTNTIAKFTGSTSIGNSLLTDNGSTLSYSGVFNFTSGKFYSVTNSSGQSYELYVDAGDGANSWRHIYGGTGTGYGVGVGGYGVYYDGNSAYNAIFNPSGFVTFEYSARSPIFYDSQNTGFYIDPSGSSVFNNSITTASINGGLRVTSSGTATTQAAIAIQQVTGEGDTIIFADYEPFAEYGIIARNAIDSIDFTAGTTSNSIDSYNITNRSGSTRTAYVKTRINLASGVTTMGDARAPIFYDSNNTGFYLDPTSSSRLINLELRNNGSFDVYDSGNASFVHLDARAEGSHSAAYKYTYSTATGTYGAYREYWYDGDSYQNIIQSGDRFTFSAPITAASDMRAPIFYDSNNTGYYVDPNSTSNLYLANFGDNSSSDQGIGIYYGNNSSGYGRIRFYQSGSNHSTIHSFSNSWNSGNLQNSSSGAINISGNTGVTFGDWNNVDMWTDRSGNMQTRGSMRSPIFYDSNDTSYYVDPNSVSVQWRLTNVGLLGANSSNARNHFVQFNSGTTSPSAGWIAGAFGDASANRVVIGQWGSTTQAIIGSHTGSLNDWAALGYVATEHIFYAPSWNTGEVLKVNTNGIYAPIFYDSNNTGFYLDPNAIGTSLRIAGNVIANGSFGSDGWGASSANEAVRVFAPKGASASWDGNPVGAIKIRLPQRANNTMWSMKVRIYSYATNQTAEYTMGNYSYSQGGWNSSAHFIGASSAIPRNVRFGNEGGYDCVWIGETNTIWDYPVVSVMDFQGGFRGGNSNNWASGWDISYVTSFGTVAEVIYPTLRVGALISSNTINSPSGYISSPNPWSTGDSAYFPNGISTAGGTNWVYGLTYIGNAPGNGAGHEFYTSGSSYSTGNMEAGSSMRAPIFYDRNNTTYYGDFASISSMYGVAIRGDQSSVDTSNQIFFWGGGNTTTSAIGFKANGGSFANPTGTGDGYNTYFTMDTVGRGWVFRRGVGGPDFGSAYTSGWILNNGVWQANDSMRAPIFYDSNNTGFYFDGASGTNLNYLNVNGTWNFSPFASGQAQLNINGTYPSITQRQTDLAQGYWLHHVDSSGQYLLYGGRGATNGSDWNWAFRAFTNQDGNRVEFRTDVRAPIFYDLDNTAYYINAGSGSVLNWLTVNDWYYLSGSTGLYWSAYSRGLTSPEGGSNSYGTVTTTGSGRNGWSGYGIGSRHVLMSTTGDNIGIHDNSRGWLYYWNGGYHQFYFGYLAAEGSMRSPIFYDSDDTGYYINPNSNSNLAALQVQTGVATNSFYATGAGGQITITAAIGSFGGYLRTSGHMVLDQTNTGYGVYVLDGNSVGVVKNAGAQSWSAFSDRTLKNIHSVIEDNLSKIQSITPIYYSFNNFADDKNRIGLIAQEVQEQFPELVEVEPRTQKLTLDYTGLIPVLLGAIKELKTEIETLKTKQ